MGDREIREKRELLKKALKIVNELAEVDYDVDEDELVDLIAEAKKLKKSRWWDVPKK